MNRSWIVLLLLLPRIAVAQPIDAGVPADASPDAAPDAAPPPEPPPTPPPTPTPPPPRQDCNSTIDGDVVDVSTHEVIAGATVRVNNRVIADTDANGRFALRGLCPGPLVIEVERVDYIVGRRTITLAAAHRSSSS